MPWTTPWLPGPSPARKRSRPPAKRMSRGRRTFANGIRWTFLLVTSYAITGRECRAQAWTPPAGEGAVSFSYQRIDNTGHRLTDGSLLKAGQSVDMSLYIEGGYAFTDRLFVSAGIPFVGSKY